MAWRADRRRRSINAEAQSGSNRRARPTGGANNSNLRSLLAARCTRLVKSGRRERPSCNGLAKRRACGRARAEGGVPPLAGTIAGNAVSGRDQDGANRLQATPLHEAAQVNGPAANSQRARRSGAGHGYLPTVLDGAHSSRNLSVQPSHLASERAPLSPLISRPTGHAEALRLVPRATAAEPICFVAPLGRIGKGGPYRERLVIEAETVFGDLMVIVVEAAARGANSDAGWDPSKAGRMQSVVVG
ncbi:hypothetical protein PMIN01_01899 [Paraphaeosphaeria minitans]|uniref:Uncharacterized protein n=1 Tax=Paraphaeosphaeria minitans TaxID=565426 RepID=A0A9P6GRN6_9PLEO|nr:hypothetical protein PMIN01_01899 [Paraphaeosphaeria minitans]